ncbi:helix-turn-helix domain-containing protein [Streptomyces sp. NPDC023723]|uniref:TetR/AcrR family transcriptional regulator n=1 Tax=Streptomyces sp. NPDC023723 TaxID=3154323 RepID=UPI0033C65EF9
MSPAPGTAAPSRRPRRGREDVLAAATALFHERGHDATSMSDIAGRLGVTKAALYRHVRGRAEVLREVTGPVRAALRSLPAVGAAGDGRSPVAELTGLLDALARAAAADPVRHAVFWGVGGTPSPDAADAGCRAVVAGRLAQLLARAAARGETARDLDPAVTAQLLLGAVVGTAVSTTLAAAGEGDGEGEREGEREGARESPGDRRQPGGGPGAGGSPPAVDVPLDVSLNGLLDVLLDGLLRQTCGPRRT